MDTKSVASQLLSYLGNNPQLVSQFVEHPYSTTAAATGSDERISKDDMSQVLTQLAAQASGQSLGFTDTASAASTLMGQSGGSVHQLASALFGAATGSTNASADATAAKPSNVPSTAEILAKSAAGALAAQGLATLLTTALGTNKPKR